MNCTRILHLSSPRPLAPSPMTPVDMAMRICLASSPPLRSFLGSYDKCCLASSLFPRCHAPRPCLASGPSGHHGYDGPRSPTGGSGRRAARKAAPQKKRVVFADSRGLALANILVFKECEEEARLEMQFHLTDLEGAGGRLSLSGSDPRDAALVLDFPQPAADYLDLRKRLREQQVSLENCSIQEGSLSGTIKVQNISFEKSVWVRITFDSWLSFQDVSCRYLNNVYSCPHTDTFSFTIPLPAPSQRSEQVEFCVCYQAQEHTFWDNNRGSNYCLVPPELDQHQNQHQNHKAKARGVEGLEEECGGGSLNMEFDRFGSPRTSAGIFPQWQSWGSLENSTPYW